MRICVLVLTVLSTSIGASGAFAGWLTVNGLTPDRETIVNTSRNFSFASPPPGYSGTVTLTHADSTDGRIDTAAFLDSYNFNLNINKNLGGFTAVGLDPTGLNSVGFGSPALVPNCNGTPCQAGSGSLNFTGLVGGVLPAGTLLLIDDIDGPDSMTNVRAFDNSGQVMVPWLTLFKRFDADGPQFSPKQRDPLLNDYSKFTVTSGVYNFPRTQHGDTDAPTFWFYTARNISTIDFDFGVNTTTSRGFILFMAAPDVVVPEPSSRLLLAVGIAALAVRNSRRRKVHCAAC